MRKVEKGFTLIEVLVVMSILSLGCAFAFGNTSHYTKSSNHIAVQFCNNSIVGFINERKEYCREKEIPGYILFDTSENRIVFRGKGKSMDKFILPTGFVLYDANLKESKIEINSKGITGDACTIKYRDEEGVLHEITMCVGTSYVDIKK